MVPAINEVSTLHGTGTLEPAHMWRMDTVVGRVAGTAFAGVVAAGGGGHVHKSLLG